MNCALLAKWIKFSVKKTKRYWKIGKKYLKSQGIISVRKSGNPVYPVETNTNFKV